LASKVFDASFTSIEKKIEYVDFTENFDITWKMGLKFSFDIRITNVSWELQAKQDGHGTDILIDTGRP